MTQLWITPPFELLAARSSPLLAEEAHKRELTEALEALGAHVQDLAVGPAQSVIDFFLLFRSVVRLPDWCANGWDPLYDAFEELCAENDFPLALLIYNLPEWLETSAHLALETVVRLEDLGKALAKRERQLIVIYVSDAWS